MPKIKNKLFCNACGKPMLLFETEKKAESFIRFNGYTSHHAYFCDFCAGWHVANDEDGQTSLGSAEELIGRYQNYKQSKQVLTTEDEYARDIAVKALKEILEQLCKCERLGVCPTAREKAEITKIWNKSIPSCKAPKLKNRIRFYFDMFNIHY